jgi:hypothetical protein
MRNAEELNTIDGMKYLASVPKNEIIKAMAVYEGKLFVTTDKHIYTLEDDKRLELVE